MRLNNVVIFIPFTFYPKPYIPSKIISITLVSLPFSWMLLGFCLILNTLMSFLLHYTKTHSSWSTVCPRAALLRLLHFLGTFDLHIILVLQKGKKNSNVNDENSFRVSTICLHSIITTHFSQDGKSAIAHSKSRHRGPGRWKCIFQWSAVCLQPVGKIDPVFGHCCFQHETFTAQHQLQSQK